MIDINRHDTPVNKIIRKNKYACIFTGKYRFSPYQGCGHSCKYCDGRYEKYGVAGDFEKDIVIRNNIPDLLEKELLKLREKGAIGIHSGITDAYQPIETQEKIMTRAAQIFARYNFPVAIMTKSARIGRDIDYWKQVHQRAGFTLMVSLTFIDDDLRKIFEPYASSVSERLEILRIFKERGMYTGVLAMPFIPYISDSEEQITALVKTLKEIGIDFVWHGGLTLKKGRQKEIFMETIQRHFPHLLEKFQYLYHQDQWHGSPVPAYYEQRTFSTDDILQKFSIPIRPPHYIYKDQFHIYDEILNLLDDMITLYRRKGVDIRRLKESRIRFFDWFMPRKRYYSRRRNLDYQDLDHQIVHAIKNDELLPILQNKKLNQFLKDVAVERKTFDYVRLELD